MSSHITHDLDLAIVIPEDRGLVIRGLHYGLVYVASSE